MQDISRGFPRYFNTDVPGSTVRDKRVSERVDTCAHGVARVRNVRINGIFLKHGIGDPQYCLMIPESIFAMFHVLIRPMLRGLYIDEGQWEYERRGEKGGSGREGRERRGGGSQGEDGQGMRREGEKDRRNV